MTRTPAKEPVSIDQTTCSYNPWLKGSATNRHTELLARIVGVYDALYIRAYCKVRFTIININILHILALCLRGKRRILDVGCGFGLFGCYLASIYPEISYRGYDVDKTRVEMANLAADRLGLRNARFYCQDARKLTLDDEFDAIMMIDLLHHLEDQSKQALLAQCATHLVSDGRLVIKDVRTRPFLQLAFTWALDVLVTRGFDMWYWNEGKFFSELACYFRRVEIFPIADWMPYPHVVYLCEGVPSAGEKTKRFLSFVPDSR